MFSLLRSNRMRLYRNVCKYTKAFSMAQMNSCTINCNHRVSSALNVHGYGPSLTLLSSFFCGVYGILNRENICNEHRCYMT